MSKFKVHRDAAVRHADPDKPKSGPVKSIKLDGELLDRVKEISDDDLSRVEFIDDRTAIVWNSAAHRREMGS